MNAPLPCIVTRDLGDYMRQQDAAEALDDFEAAVASRASLIERAALPEDVTDVLGALVLPEDVTVIVSAFRAGCAEAACPVMARILRREWREMAETECLAIAQSSLSGAFSEARITAKDLKRAAVLSQMGVKA